MTQFWVRTASHSYPAQTNSFCSIRFLTTSPVKLHMNHGLCQCIMSFSLSSRPLWLAFSINLCLQEFWIDTLNSIYLARRMNFSLKQHFGSGLPMRCIIVWSVFTCILRTVTDSFPKILFGFSVILFWGDLRLANGLDSGHWLWGTALYLTVLLTVLGKAALISE